MTFSNYGALGQAEAVAAAEISRRSLTRFMERIMAMNLTEFDKADIVLRVGTQFMPARRDASVKAARFRVLPSGRLTDRASARAIASTSPAVARGRDGKRWP